jgi:uncharacterized protein YdaU (DUF1376 family)
MGTNLSMTADIWMPLYVGDYLAATRRLDTEQHGAYLLLIMDYWKQGPLPDCDCTLARIVVSTLDGWRRLRPAIEPFFQVRDGQWHHGRIDRERTKAGEQYAAVLENSRKGVEARRRMGQLPKEPKVQPKVQPADDSGENQRRTTPQSQPPSPPESSSQPVPPNPQRGNGEDSQKTIFSLQSSIGKEFGRADGEAWGNDDERALAEIARRPSAFDEWQLVRCFRNSVPKDRVRFEGVASLRQVLKNWTDILDKVRTDYDPSGDVKARTPKPTKDAQGVPLTQERIDYLKACESAS